MGASTSIPKPPKYSIVLPDTEDRAAGSGAIHRNPMYPDQLYSYAYEDARTLYEIFQRGVRISGRDNCLGYRPQIGTGEDARVGDFVWFTYNQIAQMRDNIGSGMLRMNLNPEGESGMRLVGVFSKNRYEWVVTEQACNAYRSVLVPLYDTLGPEAVAYVVNQCKLTTVFCGKEQTEHLLTVKREHEAEAASLKNVVQFEDVTDAERGVAAGLGITLRSFEEVAEEGGRHPSDHQPPAPSDIATFCYTSGTTGNPKGAMLTHGNIVADCAGAVRAGVQLDPADVHLSYLPLAHMFERIVHAAIYMGGASVGFFQGDAARLMDDLAALRPTLFPSVPRLYNKIYDKVMGGVNTAGGVKATLFNSAFEAKQYWLARGHLKYGFWDSLVFDAVKAKVGLENCRLMLTGSAPIATHVMEFLRIVFGVPVLEGYGQTECAAAATVTHLSDHGSFGHVGMPLACNEIKLVSVDEMGYKIDDRVHGQGETAIKCEGRGEVCYRGPNVFKGYYDMPEKTAEAIDADGWLHSGDIGIWTATGQLKIVDRKKNIFKLSQGEYVAAEKIENVYAASLLVAQIFVYGDSLQSVLVAIVVPDPDQLKLLAERHGIKGDHASWCANEEVKTLVKAEMDRVGKEARLRGFEFAKRIHLEPVAWTDILTPTFKLKRVEAKKKYRVQIDAMYDEYTIGGKKGLKQGADGATSVVGGAGES